MTEFQLLSWLCSEQLGGVFGLDVGVITVLFSRRLYNGSDPGAGAWSVFGAGKGPSMSFMKLNLDLTGRENRRIAW